MGMFDYVHVDDPRIVCSEGHDMRELPFQTKGFSCTMGDVFVRPDPDGVVRVDIANYVNGNSYRLSHGRFTAYTFCEQCPAFVGQVSGNVITVWVEFEIEVSDGAVSQIRRLSEATEDWLTSGKKTIEPIVGPMPRDQAQDIAAPIRRARIMACRR